jgi:hypothetical protein
LIQIDYSEFSFPDERGAHTQLPSEKPADLDFEKGRAMYIDLLISLKR